MPMHRPSTPAGRTVDQDHWSVEAANAVVQHQLNRSFSEKAQELRDALEACAACARKHFLPSFDLDRVSIYIAEHTSSQASPGRISLSTTHVELPQREYTHLERMSDLSIQDLPDGLWWLAAHEMAHLIVFTLTGTSVRPPQDGIIDDHPDLSTWKNDHRRMLEAFRWYSSNRRWRGPQRLAEWSPVAGAIASLTGGGTRNDHPLLEALLSRHTCWEGIPWADGWGYRIASQPAHGSCFEFIYRTLRHHVVHPYLGLRRAELPTRPVAYNKAYFRRQQRQHRPLLKQVILPR